ncbi:cytochrome P450 [Laetiporus sulphureus 93-53]|uniref:Cytochrome P450 n=1 Tax=Laetiporus sulphureus 93-53 TaxID=1314785 RepID=A0A165F348_9APHY|nr:cytochrome P450 [Laetiporus sulphureus 93-53]KZT08277.1 cytochrome P450 [Laetiporus sulphureus 93-53]
MPYIPAVGGSSLPILSWYGSFRAFKHASEMIQEGYDKYKGGIFKYPELAFWRVVVTSPREIEEVCRAPESVLSFAEAANSSVQIEYTLGPNVHHNPYHIPLIQSQLTRNIGRVFPEIMDEVVSAFNDEVPIKGDEWIKVRAKDAVIQIICREANRAFVGLPLCRNQDFCDLNKTFTYDVILAALIIKVFPRALKPLVAKFMTNVPAAIQRGVNHLEPLILERFRMIEQHGKEWADKPNDMLQWLIDAAEGEERAVRPIVLRVLSVNFAALHTTSTTFTQALFYLATHPQYIAPLREEVDAIVAEEGWTKAAMGKMRRADSFLKEVHRVTGLGAWSINRKAVQDFTFSNGTVIPAGTYVAASARPIHLDEENYEDSLEFKPWRFVDVDGGKQHLISTADNYLTFGHGKFACPGRFFAANALKAMLAHMVYMYDIKMEDENVRPEELSSWIVASLVPNRKVEVMFRKRQA